MSDTGPHETTYLSLDELAANPRLARRLPLDLALRFHALPLAEDNGRITVAMAHPEDAEARDAVIRALGPASCLVQGDPATIDTLLARIWGNRAADCPSLLVYNFPEPVTDEVKSYVKAMGDLLGAHVSHLDAVGEAEALNAEECQKHDLVFFGEPGHPLLHRLLSRPSTAAFAVLAARRPRWPLRSLLLVIWGQETDEAAVDWIVRLARLSGSAATVLAIVPPVPAMYGCRGRMDPGLPALLTSNTPLGKCMHRAAQRLVDWEVEGTLRLRQGPPTWQICREVDEGDYDLIAMAVTPRWRWQKRLEGDPVSHLLCRLDRPLLVAKPATA